MPTPPLAAAAADPDADSARWTVADLALANLRGGDGPHLAVRADGGLIDVTAAARDLGLQVPRSTDSLLRDGEGQLRQCLAQAARGARWCVDPAQAAFAPSVLHPGKIVCIGLNYRRHAQEVGLAVPEFPALFSKFPNALTHHGATVPTAGLPGNCFDYEVELVIVMGRRCAHAAAEDALDHVYGYSTGNDLSERKSQGASSQWLAGKTSDGFAPLGPYLVGAALVGDPHRLALETRVNGELRQSSNTSDLIFDCRQLIAYCSALFPLDPGDIIYTGTPEGVILGLPPERRVWLRRGDVVETTVEKLGTLRVTLG